MLSASSALLSKRNEKLCGIFLALFSHDQHPLLAFGATAPAHHTPAGRLDRVWLVVDGVEILIGVFLGLIIQSVQNARSIHFGGSVGNEGLKGRIDYTLHGTSRLPVRPL